MANLTDVVLLLAAEGGSAAAPLTEHEVLVFLVQLALLVGVARVFGWLMKSVGQPPVMGELLAGVVLGPTLFGRVAPVAQAGGQRMGHPP